MRTIAIGLLGAGNVGAGVLRILDENAVAIERRLGAKVVVKRVAVRDPGRVRGVAIAPRLLTTDPTEVIGDPDVRVVVELIGGVEAARSHVLAALAERKHVVTANKALLATAGRELFAAAAGHGVSIHFEAAVAGGIPILRTLREGLASDEIESIWGIVNGTSNYVLDAMTRSAMSFAAAVQGAQAAGFAEADPTLDVDGTDAAQKLALLCLLAFGVRIDPALISCEGIARVRAFDIATAGELGFLIKSLAFVQNSPAGLSVRVHPALVPARSILAGVRGSYNAILVQSRAMGRSLYYGRGAGMMPTGMAVVSDIIDVCRSIVAFADAGPPPQAFGTIVDATPLPLGRERHENYLCVHVPNVAGVLGRVASTLGRHGVSIKRVKQEPQGPQLPVDMVLVTEAVEDAALLAALAEVDAFDEVLEPTRRFRIVDPDPLE